MSERTKQWFGFLGGALAWLIHLLITYAIGEGACILEGSLFVFLGLSASGWLLIGITLAMVALTIAALRVSWGYRNDQREGIRFLGRAGLISNLLFLLIIAAQSTPIAILLREC